MSSPFRISSEPIAELRQNRVHVHAELGSQDLAGVAGADGVDELRPFDALAQQEHAVGAGLQQRLYLVGTGEAGKFGPRKPALVGKVVDRDHDRRPGNKRVGGVSHVPEDHRGHGLPIVEVQHVHGSIIDQERLEGGPAQQPEAPAVVRVISVGVAVEPVAVERGWVVDQPHPVTSSFELHE